MIVIICDVINNSAHSTTRGFLNDDDRNHTQIANDIKLKGFDFD